MRVDSAPTHNIHGGIKALWGKLIGGVGGFLVGGPAGAAAGAALGHLFDGSNDESASQQPNRRTTTSSSGGDGYTRRSEQDAYIAQQKDQEQQKIKVFLDYRHRSVKSFAQATGLLIRTGGTLKDSTVAIPIKLEQGVYQAIDADYAEQTSELMSRKAQIVEALRLLEGRT